jgi:cystathionine gamma-synthase/methionine-gamma-lyase
MKMHTKAVHAGDRKRTSEPVPVSTPIYTAASYFYPDVESLDKVFAHELHGYAYQRYDNPTNAALEELVTALEGGHGRLATASGMAALRIALEGALLDRRKKVLSATAMYGATIKLLEQVMAPFGVETRYVDICDLAAVEKALAEYQPGAVLMETVSNPVLRVGEIDKVAALCRKAGAALVVDNTFATPLLARPIELGAHISVHSVTKYLSGHGDVLGGLVTSDEEHFEPIRQLSRVYGPTLGPFEGYLAMRGIKTFPLRMERQCANAAQVAAWLRAQPKIGTVHYLDDPAHPDAAAIARLLPAGLRGAMVSFELKDAGREQVFAFMNRMKMIVPATSLGDVHTMMLYPAISSHRDVPPAERRRQGIHDNLVRLSVGIEAVEDILADLGQALG